MANYNTIVKNDKIVPLYKFTLNKEKHFIVYIYYL